MHATYPPVIHHHPAMWGTLLGIVLGASLVLGGLLALDRVDLSSHSVALTPSEMMVAHWVREHGDPALATKAAALELHLLREHAADIMGPAGVTMTRHAAIEHAGDLVISRTTWERVFLLEHGADLGR
jgi:hypothetical protein